MTTRHEDEEHILEHLWTLEVEGDRGDVPPAGDLEALARLEGRGLVCSEDGRPALTERGRREARSVVRRHRLAERLMHDVLDEPDMDTACRMEHLLSADVEASLCTLLGHPTECPHGLPIPPGDCCTEHATTVRRAVVPATDLREGQEGMVAYVRASGRGKMQKLLALGIVPGTSLRMVQRTPAFVLATDGAQIAVDHSVAKEVFVRVRQGRGQEAGRGPGPGGHRWRWRSRA